MEGTGDSCDRVDRQDRKTVGSRDTYDAPTYGRDEAVDTLKLPGCWERVADSQHLG